jgi:hypothetical protein
MSIHVWDEVRGTRGFSAALRILVLDADLLTPDGKSMGTVSNAAHVIRLWMTLETLAIRPQHMIERETRNLTKVRLRGA